MYPLPQKVNIPVRAHYNYVPETPVEITVDELNEREPVMFIPVGFKGTGKTMFNFSNYITPIEFISLISDGQNWKIIDFGK